MNNYELTERGKIVIAVILVIILLVIPAIVILAMSSCTDSTSSGQEGASSEPDTSPVIASTPEQPSDDVENGNVDPVPTDTHTTPEPAPDPTLEPTPDNGSDDDSNQSPIEQGPIGLDLVQGTMAFIFALDSDVGLGTETVEMVGEFLTSPKNASNTLIQINMPNLSSEDEAVFLAAVSDAFSAYDITEDDVLFVKNNADVTERAIEVSLSFAPIGNNRK